MDEFVPKVNLLNFTVCSQVKVVRMAVGSLVLQLKKAGEDVESHEAAEKRVFETILAFGPDEGIEQQLMETMIDVNNGDYSKIEKSEDIELLTKLILYWLLGLKVCLFLVHAKGLRSSHR